jgi:hypothetical protein
MTTISVRRVQYLLEEHTRSEIARETGLSSYMVNRVATGLRDVPEELRAAVRNFYQRDAYARARESGMSATQARRFSWYAPETATATTLRFHDKVLELAGGAAQERLSRMALEGEDITQSVIDQVYSEAYVDMQEALRDSKAAVEEITSEDY